MNWDRIQANWKQYKGNAKQQWGKLTSWTSLRAGAKPLPARSSKRTD